MLRLDAADVPRAEQLLELAGAAAISIDDAGDDPVLEPPPGETPLWPKVVLRALFEGEAALEDLARMLVENSRAELVSLETLDDRRWRPALEREPTARPIGSRLWLGSADASAATAADRVCVRLHMGLAFGTGEHATTSLCLDWLDANVRGGVSVLDYGCGTGVLALAALGLGANRAWAVDNDEQALGAARRNAALNAFAGDRLWIGAPENLPPVQVDIVVANILARPLIELAPVFAEHALPGGTLVLSGVLAAQAPEVCRAYEPYCERFALAERDGWMRIAAGRRAISR